MSSLAPQPRFRIVDADGIALEGGKVYTYAAGTSTPKDSYTDSTLGSANTNPVILEFVVRQIYGSMEPTRSSSLIL